MTGFLVRAVAANWAKGSVLAVDAGTHLSAITRILKKDFPLVSQPKVVDGRSEDGDDSPSSSSSRDSSPEATFTTLADGPFAGLPFPHESARANALHVVREQVATYLITHPHLDHVSGFVINTASFHNTSRPKRLAALSSTVNAIKTHIFNDILWPNLTDEDGGVGFVTFQRLTDGGNIALGEGHGRGYIEVCNGLSAKGFRISHGHCIREQRRPHRGSIPNIAEPAMHLGTPLIQPTGTGVGGSGGGGGGSGREARSLSFSMPSQPGTPLVTAHATATTAATTRATPERQTHHVHQTASVTDSTAFFIRAEPLHPSVSAHAHAREILIFGDVEPDAISLSPRTFHVWAEAAPKIAAGTLTGIFIECSYSDVQGDAVLFGHLAPRHLVAELASLAEMVRDARREHDRERELHRGRKRKRHSNPGFLPVAESATWPTGGGVVGGGGGLSPEHHHNQHHHHYHNPNKDRRRSSHTPQPVAAALPPLPDEPMHGVPFPTVPLDTTTNTATATAAPTDTNASSAAVTPRRRSTSRLPPPSSAAHHNPHPPAPPHAPPLQGLRVVVIHVKDTFMDGPPAAESILAQLQAHERGLGLGCEFVISEGGGCYWF